MGHPFNRMPLSKKRAQTTGAGNNMDELKMHYTKWRKPYCVSIYMTLMEKENNNDRIQIHVCQGPVMWEEFTIKG